MQLACTISLEETHTQKHTHTHANVGAIPGWKNGHGSRESTLNNGQTWNDKRTCGSLVAEKTHCQIPELVNGKI